jgi:hypothetical protein
MPEISSGERTTERTMRDLRSLYGGDNENGDPSRWVFVPEGVSKGAGVNFFDEYVGALLGHRKKPPGLPGRKLLFDTNFETEPRNGKEAEKLFFDYFNTTSDYFSHPANIGKLGLITRQFLSHYVDENLLGDVDPRICEKLEEMEDEVTRACPGSRADMADLLRLMYNRALSNTLTHADAVEIKAGKFGEHGKSLTLIDMPRDLIAKRRMDEMQMSRNGKIYCLEDVGGDVYQRGGWTEMEWAEAKMNISSETQGNPIDKATRLKAIDQFYFPQKVCYSVGSCYNLLKTLRDTVISQCNERREFSIARFVSVLREQRREKEGGSAEFYERGSQDHVGAGDHSYPEYEGGLSDPEAESLPDEEELDAPLRKRPELLEASGGVGEGSQTKTNIGKDGGEGSEGGVPATKDTKANKPSKTRRVTKSPLQKAVEGFSRKWGISGGTEVRTLEAIFSKEEGFAPSDYSSEIHAFCKTTPLPKDSSLEQWISKSQRARGMDEGRVLAKKSLPERGAGKVAVVVEKEEGGSAVLLAKRVGAGAEVLFKEMTPDEIERAGKIRNGRLFLREGEGGFKPVFQIRRSPYRLPEGAKAEIGLSDKGKVLPKGGIFSFLRKFTRGEKSK